MSERIGFIGLGLMGRPMAVNLAAKGYTVQAYDVRPEAADGLDADRVTWGGSIQRIAETSSVILVMVFSGEQVREVVMAPEGILQHAAPGTLVVDITSSDPAITRELEPLLQQKGIDFIDAPCSGGVEAAVKGTLTFMTGGNEPYLDRARPLLEVMGNNIMHMGPIGSGHAMKVMNNFISATTMAATAEVVALARKAGIPADRVVEALRNSTVTSDAATRKFPQYIFPDKEIGFPIKLMHKDIKTYLQFAEKIGIPTLISTATFQIWNLNVVEGLGASDAVHFVDPYERWCGAPIRGLTK
jgi:3-hydroxyisobutyrate dehydrogenase-like beta-hydroxyacid dehydrogenase